MDLSKLPDVGIDVLAATWQVSDSDKVMLVHIGKGLEESLAGIIR